MLPSERIIQLAWEEELGERAAGSFAATHKPSPGNIQKAILRYLDEKDLDEWREQNRHTPVP